jgi:NAD+ diphosphatase
MESDGRRKLKTLHCMKCGHVLSTRASSIKPEHVPKSLVNSAANVLTRQVCTQAGCGWVFYNNPLPIVAAIVELTPSPSSSSSPATPHQREIVLVRGVGWPKSWLGLVTGFLEGKERPEDGVLREVKEELGLDGSVKSFLGVYSFPRINQLILAYHVVADAGQTISLQEEELEAYKTVPIERLRPWKEGTGLAVREFLRRELGKEVPWEEEAFSRKGVRLDEKTGKIVQVEKGKEGGELKSKL